MIDTIWLDRANSLIEFGILTPFVADCWALWRARDSRAISLGAQVTYLLYCCWWAIYFAALGQFWTVGASLMWICAYVVRISLVIRFRPARSARVAEGR